MTTSDHPPINVDFFCIGAGKSGSTWLAQCLDEHPQITIARDKEPNFFVRKLSAFGGEINGRLMKDWRAYSEQYEHASDGDLLGDFSVNLMHNVDDAPRVIKEHYPNAKLLVILRDPVKRTYSHYWHERDNDRVPGVPRTFEQGLENEELLFRSRFGDQLAAWREAFPKESFFVIFDFEIAQDPDSVYERALAFLGADPSFVAPSLHRRLNESTWKSPLLFHLFKAVTFARSRGLGWAVDLASRAGLKRMAQNRLIRKRKYPPMKPEVAARLRRYFLPDIEKLETLFDVDLSEWKVEHEPSSAT